MSESTQALPRTLAPSRTHFLSYRISYGILIFFQYKVVNDVRGDVKFAGITFELAEVMTVALTETQNYPLSACISDTGGAAGLFLGLHVIGDPYLRISPALDKYKADLR